MVPITKRTSRTTKTRAATRARGLTVVEMVLALTICALIGTSLAAVVYASSLTLTGTQAKRTIAVANDTCSVRLNTALRGSTMVLAQGSNYVVLWLADLNGNASPQLSEIQRIERDPNALTLTSYQAPTNLSAANNTTYALASTNFNTVTSALKGTTNFPGTVWATSVTGWSTLPAPANPQLLRYLEYQITTTSGGVSLTTIGGAGLRDH